VPASPVNPIINRIRFLGAPYPPSFSDEAGADTLRARNIPAPPLESMNIDHFFVILSIIANTSAVTVSISAMPSTRYSRPSAS
jgi:hypothetical protein